MLDIRIVLENFISIPNGIYKSSPTDTVPLEGSFSILNLIQSSTELNQGSVNVLFIL